LLLTDEAVEGYRTEAKMNPPLRAELDRQAVLQGLADGTLDVLATDHAPHHYDEKEQAFEDAPFGIVGVETAFGLAYTHLVLAGVLDLPALIDRMSVTPARVMGLPGGTLLVGSPADVTVFDPDATWTVEPRKFLSKSRNTPFSGWELTGKPTMTVVEGKVVWEDVDR
jgi:dihydroorotase